MDVGDVLMLLSLVIIVCAFGGSVYMHEVAHQTINTYFGVSSHIEFFGGALGSTVVDSGVIPEAGILAHSINEAVGYQLLPLFLGIMALQIIGIMLNVNKQDVEKWRWEYEQAEKYRREQQNHFTNK